MPQKKTVHLYWAHRLPTGEKLLSYCRKCLAECGKYDLPPEEVTLDRKLVTCAECRARASRPKRAEPEPEKVITPPDATRKLPKGEWPWPPGAVIRLLSPSNPHGAAKNAKGRRWAQVWAHGGKPWEKYRDAGGNPETLRNVVKQKLAEVEK